MPVAMSHQQHGSIPYTEARELGIPVRELTDFSATVNPHPLPEAVRASIRPDMLAGHPDTGCRDAAAALASFHRVPEDWITVTAGMTESIFILPQLYNRAVQFGPTYGDYEAAYRRFRKPLTTVAWPVGAQALHAALSRLEKEQFKILIICNPNNPDGHYLEPEIIGRLCMHFRHVRVCVDESYQELGRDCVSALELVREHKNLLVLRSLTKPFGIGGLRAGYAVSSGGILKRLRHMQLPWGVGTMAQRVIPAILDNMDTYHCHWDMIRKEHDRMTGMLKDADHTVHVGRVPFFLVRTGRATAVRRRLLQEHRLVVRDCTSFGMPDQIRIMPLLPEQNDCLLELLAEMKSPRIP